MPTHYTHESVLRMCLHALNSTPKFAITGSAHFNNSYALAAEVSAHLDRHTATPVEALGPPHLEVHVCGMRPDEDGMTLADDIDDVTSWDVELRLYLRDGSIHPLIERTYPTYAQASEASDALLRLFPDASISEWPEH